MSELVQNYKNQLALLEQESKSDRKPYQKKVLDEETYVKDLEAIIERDFFPDLEKLKVQQIYLEAKRTNNYETLNDLYRKYSIKRKNTHDGKETPRICETPEIRAKEVTRKKDSCVQENPFINQEPPEINEPSGDTLDKYLAKNTSEDNSSFKQIMVEAEKRDDLHAHRQWLVEQERKMIEERKDYLEVLPIEEQAVENNKGLVDSWSYKSKNALMFVPDGVELTYEEELERSKRERVIVHENTRFKLYPFNIKQQKESLVQAAEHKALQLSGKLGVDGRELNTGETPKVNGYGLVAASPSITPGRLPGDESPMMTWGEIEGTPFRLEAATPYSCHSGDGPEFKIPDVPEREKILLSLEEKANAARRKKKQDALSLIQRNLSSPKCDSPSSLQDKISFMSPAAQKLLSSKIRVNTDKTNSRDDTPSPALTLRTSTTPLRSPLNKLVKRPHADSITDNLLKLPKIS